MYRKHFEEFFNSISKQFVVAKLAKESSRKIDNCIKVVDDTLPVFDALDLLEENECLVLNDGLVIERNYMLKRPLRIVFFVLLTELESRLYRINEWSEKPIKELNEQNMNDFIRHLVDDENLFSYQKVYGKRSELKEDLKAVSSFRNVICHTTKKLEMDTDFETVVKRKKQMLRLIESAAQVLDEQEKIRNEKT